MAIYKEDFVEIELTTGTIHRSFLQRTLGEGDVKADRFGVRVMRNGQPASLSGCTCSGYFIRADGGTTVISNGVITGNEAYVTIPAACYAVEGQFSLAIKLSGDGVTGTMRIVDGVVANTDTGTYIDPGTILPSIEDLIEAINEAVESIPSDYSELNGRVDNLEDQVYVSDIEWKQGYFTSGGGIRTDTQTRIYTPNYYKLDAFVRISVDNAIKLRAVCYTESKEFLGRLITTSRDFGPDLILTDYPTTKWVRFYTETDTLDEFGPEDVDTYHLKLNINEAKQDEVANTFPSITNIRDLENDDGEIVAGTYLLQWTIQKNDTKPVLVTMEATYTGANPPTIQMNGYRGTRQYYSHIYDIGSPNEYKRQQWRLPNGLLINRQAVNIIVPENTTMKVRGFEVGYDTGIRKGTGNIIFHAHRGLEKLYPPDTYNGVVGAAEMGFQSCIMIPKFTADGVPVCFHNDGSSSSKLSAQITMPDGSPVSVLTDDSKISDFTYAELMQWSVGASTNTFYGDAKILRMDDFLRVCANTGMRPIFSIHPDLTVAQWQVIKGLLDRYKLTKWTSVKTGNTSAWGDVMSVFGDGNIYSIICIYSTSSVYDIVNRINTARQTYNIEKTRIDAEFFDDGLQSATYGSTQMAQLEAAVAAGLVVSVVLANGTPGNRMKFYIEKGVTEFTNCRHWSIGLNW